MVMLHSRINDIWRTTMRKELRGVLYISKLLTFRKLNQRISASVQGTPRRGNEHIAQGSALGMMKR